MRFCLLVMLITLTDSLSAQSKLSYSGLPSSIWPKLYDITYEKKDDNPFGNPLFSKAAKELNGKMVTLPGYIFPFQNNSMKSDHFMLSSVPLNACFFCGVGGPETAVEVFMKQPLFYTDKPIEIKGRLFLNDKNPDQLIYVLKEVEFLGEVEF